MGEWKVESNAQRALEAWKKWWKFSGDPAEHDRDRDGWGVFCFFCGETINGPESHEKDCPYLTVAQIAEEEGW